MVHITSPPDIIVSSKNPKKIILASNFSYNLNLLSKYKDLSYQLKLNEIKKFLYFRNKFDFGIGEINPKDKRNLEKLQFMIMSKTAPEIEVTLKRKIYNKQIEDNLPPFKISYLFKNIEDIDNIKIPKHVEKVYYDYDLKAIDGMLYLYKKGYDIENISRYLSMGILGKEANRRIIPTKHAISASDSYIADKMIKNIRTYEILDEIYLFYGEHYDNHFTILFLPREFSFELIEIIRYKSHPIIKADYEDFYGRKTYAENTGGGYYAIRFGITEYLEHLKKQASVVVVRDIKPSYYMSLGVWVLRESIREITSKKLPKRFSNINLVLEYLKQKSEAMVYKKLSKSFVIRSFIKQRKLF